MQNLVQNARYMQNLVPETSHVGSSMCRKFRAKCNFSSTGLPSNPSNLGAKIEDLHHKTKLHLTWGHFQEAVQLEKSPEEIQKERTVRYELR